MSPLEMARSIDPAATVQDGTPDAGWYFFNSTTAAYTFYKWTKAWCRRETQKVDLYTASVRIRSLR